jgi:hypothetical protein
LAAALSCGLAPGPSRTLASRLDRRAAGDPDDLVALLVVAYRSLFGRSLMD